MLLAPKNDATKSSDFLNHFSSPFLVSLLLTAFEVDVLVLLAPDDDAAKGSDFFNHCSSPFLIRFPSTSDACLLSNACAAQ